jgi:hypothetical protein
MQPQRYKRWIGSVIGLLIALLIATVLSPPAHADGGGISITLTGTISGSAGDTITVFADLSNTSSSTYYFSDDSLTTTADGYSASDDLIINGIFGLGPVSIAGNSTLDGVDVFTVQILGGAPGTFSGNIFQLIGGTDPVACGIGTVGCNSPLGLTDFSVTVQGQTVATTPEPATFALLGLGLGALALIGRRVRRAGTVGVQ